MWSRPIVSFATVCCLCGVAGMMAWADSNLSASNQFAWSANAGWLNWTADGQNGVEIDQYVCSGFIYAPNVGWISLGSGAPANGMKYQNNSATDFGVNVDTTGNLSGFAYGANIGWINFAAGGKPRIDLATGTLSGHIYSANVGWVGLSGAGYELRIDFLAEGRDSDGDGLPDAWEFAQIGDLTSLDGTVDTDHDGVSDFDEYLADTDPVFSGDKLRILDVSIALDQSTTTLTWAARPTRLYRIETRASFSPFDNWTDSGLGLVAADRAVFSQRLPGDASGGQRYFRIQAIRPLAP